MTVILAVDAAGGDHAPAAVVRGLSISRRRRPDVRYRLFGDGSALEGLLKEDPALAAVCDITSVSDHVGAEEKPARALRRGNVTGMWQALASVRDGSAHAMLSGGNTGALMAISRYVLGAPAGIERPAIAAIWPTLNGECVVLDVGANLDADSRRLYEFALMGVQFAKVLSGRDKPRVGLLNVGTEEMKGNDHVRAAAALLRGASEMLEYIGFVEGNAIGAGVVDVVVTDGFTGNIALKTAEGTARLVTSFLRNALTSTLSGRIGAWIARDALRAFKESVDPSRVNGGVFLGLNGLVIKSHGGSDARGFAAASDLAYDLAAADVSGAVTRALTSVTHSA